MKRYLLLGLAALALLPLLPLAGASAQGSFPSIPGHYVGLFTEFNDPTLGFELILQQNGRGVTGFASLREPPPSTRLPLTTEVYGEVGTNGFTQLQLAHRINTLARDPRIDPRWPNYAINMQFDTVPGSTDILPIGEKALSVDLKRVGDVPPPPAWLGKTYRLDFDRKGITADLAPATRRWKLNGASLRNRETLDEGPLTVFAPRFDPGFLIFTFYHPQKNEILFSVRVPELSAGEAGVKKDFAVLCNLFAIYPKFFYPTGGSVELVNP